MIVNLEFDGSTYENHSDILSNHRNKLPCARVEVLGHGTVIMIGIMA